MTRTQELRNGVRKAYSEAAQNPSGPHPFPVGRRFAESLGYAEDLLARMPSPSVDAFSGVSKVALVADIAPGTTVLDLGCGAGLDSLVAADRVGPHGRVIGIDFSTDMLVRAGRAAAETRSANVQFLRADAESVPLADGSIDVALANGIFNLNPAREAIFHELARVVRRGGSVYAAELILREALPAELKRGEANWFS